MNSCSRHSAFQESRLYGFIRKEVSRRKIFLTISMLISIISLCSLHPASAQTTIFNETFETATATFPYFPSSWNVVNGASGTNRWIVGTATNNGGSRGAYITNADGASPATNSPNSYYLTTTSVSHFYRDITIPSGQTGIKLTFDWRVNGETTLDYLRVFLVPTTYTPVAGTEILQTQQVGITYNSSTTYKSAVIYLSPTLAGATQRLVFSWTNNSSGGYDPPAGIDNILLTSQVPSPLSGVYSINNTLPTSGNNFNSFTAAFNTLNLNGISGAVTFNVSAGQIFNEDPPALMATGTAVNTITFQKTSGANPQLRPSGTINPNVFEFGFCIHGGDYITFDGIDVNANGGNNVEYGFLIRNASPTDGAQYNTIKNCSIILSNVISPSNGFIRGIYQVASLSYALGSFTPSAQSGANSNNKYYNLAVESCIQGIVLIGNEVFPDENCEVGAIGGGTTTVGSAAPNDIMLNTTGTSFGYGICLQAQRNGKIFNTTVRNVSVNSTATGIMAGGILVLNGVSGANFGTTEVYNNTVYNISRVYSTSTSGVVTGIYVQLQNSSAANVYNNVIHSLNVSNPSSATSTQNIQGLYVAGFTPGFATVNVYNNSVRIDHSSALNSSSTAFYCVQLMNLNLRNNIFSNFTGNQTGSSKHYAVYNGGTVTFGSVSNNVLWAPNTNGFVGYHTADRSTLELWAAAISDPAPADPREAGSINANPNFTSATDLTLASPSVARNSGVPITSPAITSDATRPTPLTRDPVRPNIGSYESAVSQSDLAPPVISNVSIASGASPTVSATITDNSAASTNATVRLWYRLSSSSGAYTGLDADAKPVGAMNGTYTWNASLAALTAGTYSFYIAVRDNVGAGLNITVNPIWSISFSGFNASDPPNYANPNPAAFANARTFTKAGTTLSAGPYTVGQKPTDNFDNLTEVASVLAGADVTNNIVFELTSRYGNVPEPGTVTFNAFAAPGNQTVTIRPQTGVTNRITAVNPGASVPVIDLNGVRNLILDGRAGGSGASQWIIRNTATSSAGPTIQFINDASGNTLRYLEIQGQNATSTSGTVLIGTTNQTNGNDNNTISNCIIRDRTDGGTAVPANAIYAAGTAIALNDNTIIQNNQISNFSTAGISVTSTGNGDNWQITGNDIFYNSTITAMPSTAQTGINFSSGRNNNTITGNTIGGSAVGAGGTPWMNSGAITFTGITISTGTVTATSVQDNKIQNISLTSTGAAAFNGINASAGLNQIGTTTGNIIGHSATANSIQNAGTGVTRGIVTSNTTGTVNTLNNLIANIRTSGAGTFTGIELTGHVSFLSSVQNNSIQSITLASTGAAAFQGFNVTAGYFEIGTVTANTITNITTSGTGATRGIVFVSAAVYANSIHNNQITNITCSGASAFTGMTLSAGSTFASSIQNNTIQGISMTSTGAATFTGISTTGGVFNVGTLTGNTIGDPSTANSVSVAGSSTAIGISNTSTAAVQISNNIIANLQATGTGTGVSLRGLVSTAGTAVISQNNIYNLSTNSGSTNTTTTPTIAGIVLSTSTATQAIMRNNIYNLVGTNSSASATTVSGIYYASPTSGTNIISGNKIHSLNVAISGTATSANVNGIYIGSSTSMTYVSNNMIRLGIDGSGSAITDGKVRFNGLRDNSSSGNANYYYFNSVYIGGSGVTGGTSSDISCAFFRESPINNTLDMRDNIFSMVRSGGSGIFVGFYSVPVTLAPLTSNYNLFFAPGNSIARSTSTNYATLTDWQNFSGYDMNSGSGDPNFRTPLGTTTTVDLRIQSPTPAEGAGIDIPSVIDDQEGDSRSANTPVDIGADAGTYTQLDIYPPTISYTPLPNTSNTTTGPTLTASIVDVGNSGVPTTGTGLPVMYYRKGGSGSFTAVTGVYVSGFNYNFTIDYSALGGVVIGNDIQYYIVAQDQASTPNVAMSPRIAPSGTAFSANPPASNNPPTSPERFSITGGLAGSMTVGTGGTYPTFTGSGGLFEAINGSIVNGDITVTVISNTTEPGTISLNQWTESGAGNYSLTLIPDGTTIREITNSASTSAAMIRFTGADRVTIDGRFGGSGRYLRFRNTTTSQPVIGYSGDATNNTIRNCIIESANTATSTTAAGAIFIGTGTATGNDFLLFTENQIRDNSVAAGQPNTCIYSNGTTGASNSDNTISNNEIINFTGTGVNITSTGNGDNWTITGNDFYYNNVTPPTAAQTGINLSSGGNNNFVTNNDIGGSAIDCGGSRWTNSGAVTFTGITLSVGGATVTSVQNNQVQNITMSGTGASALTGITVTAGLVDLGGTTGNVVGHPSISANGITLAGTGAFTGINVSGSISGQIVSNNTVANILLSLASSTATHAGIQASAGTTILQSSMQNNLVSDVVIQSTTTAKFTGVNASAGWWNVGGTMGNILRNLTLSGTGTITGINVTSASTYGSTINNNQVTNITGLTGSAPAFTAFLISGGTAFPSTMQNNLAQNIVLNGTGATTFIGISVTGGLFDLGTTTGNTIGDPIAPSSIVVAGSSTTTGIFLSSSSFINCANNIIANMDATGSGTSVSIRGIVNTAGFPTLSNNQVYNLSTNSTSTNTTTTATAIGILQTGTVPGQIISRNLIHSLSNNAGSASTSVTGIYFAGPTSGSLIERNIIHSLKISLSGPSPSTPPAVNGIYIGSSSQITLQNNMVRLGIDFDGTDLTDGEIGYRGIRDNVASGSFSYHYHNTVYIGGSASGTGGLNTVSSAFFRENTSPGTIDVRNNIFSIARSGGNGKFIGFHNAATTVTGTLNTNYNLYQLSGNLAARIGATTPTDYLTLTEWQNATGMDAQSSDGNPNFRMPNGSVTTLDMRIQSPTPAERTGVNIATVTDDQEGDTRSANTPVDIGADAGTYTPQDIFPPLISYTPLPNTTNTTTGPTLTATITDMGTSGIPTTGSGLPVMYYRKGTTGAFTSAAGVFASGNNYNFTINYSSLGGVTGGDVIQYYIAAQDAAATPNVTMTPRTAPSGTSFTSNPPAANNPPATPSQYLINVAFAGNITVGTGGTYPTLTGASGLFEALNNNIVSGNITVTILSDITEDGTNALNQWTESGSGNYTLAIQPDGTTPRVLTGTITTNALIRLNGADRVTFDGRYSGAGRYLEFAAAATANHPVFKLTGDASYNTIRNCELVSSNTSTSTTAAGIIHLGTGSVTGNDMNLIHQNMLRNTSPTATVNPAIAFYSYGTSSSVANNDNTITNNHIINFTDYGVYVTSTGNTHNWNVSGNYFYHTLTTSVTTYLSCIYLNTGSVGSGHTINDNSIGGSDASRSGTPLTSYGMDAIYLSAGTAAFSNIQGNTISNILMNGTDYFGGIEVGAGNVNVGTTAGNTIGGPLPGDAIVCDFDGDAIWISGTGFVNVQNNTVRNLSYSNNSGDQLVGIHLRSTGVYVVRNNIIRDLTSNTTSPIANYPIVGIRQSAAATLTLEGNSVFNIRNTNTGTATYYAYGIGLTNAAAGTVVRGNRIYGISADATNAGATAPYAYGLIITGGAATVSNNQISIGASVGSDVRIRGIENTSTTANNFYYNTVVVTGTTGSAVGFINDTYAYNRTSSSTGFLRNNAFVNERANGAGATGVHYAIRVGSATNWTGNTNPALLTSNHNFYSAPDPNNIAQWLTTGQSIATWKTNVTNNDVYSYSVPTALTTTATQLNPSDLFVDISIANLNINTTNQSCWFLNGKGVAGSESGSIDADYNSSSVRNITLGIPTDIGSHEFNSSTTPFLATQTGTIADMQTTTYSFAGRPLGSVYWTIGTGTLPTSVNFTYNSGVAPIGALVGNNAASYWTITESGSAPGYTYDLTLNYAPAEIGAITETNLRYAKRDAGIWSYIGGNAPNTTAKTITVNGLTSFSDFTLTDLTNPLPVELVSFTAKLHGAEVQLDWKTASELNSFRFYVERRTASGEWSEIGHVDARGSVDVPTLYTYSDNNLPNVSELRYRLRQVDRDGSYSYSNEVRVVIGTPHEFTLLTNYPNPFTSGTTISFALPQESFVTVRIYDMTGREVELLTSETMAAGIHSVSFSARNLPSGIYRYVVTAGNQMKAGTMILAR